MVACVNYYNKVGDGIMMLVKACDLQMLCGPVVAFIARLCCTFIGVKAL